uniref:Large subunit GTPase 1 homolog n=1 Tax=Panagrolaimus davidi TaxID=227884 RepID=A0A914Q6T3_9BILA
MTKRRMKNAGPTGFNKNLGNQLVNQGKAKRVYIQPNIARTASPEKVLDSVTHESNLEEFLTTAELANKDFTAERGNFKIISTNDATVVNIDDLISKSYDELKREYGELLKIPRRPLKEQYNTAEELNKVENEMFLEWRRNVSLMQESNGVVMTPFERNLELWRQLWRVIERSHVVVQIVDARNPLLFRSADLENYVKEVDPLKSNVLLVNKSDLLSPEHVQKWREYFRKEQISAVFWSAKMNIVAEEEETPTILEESDGSSETSEDEEIEDDEPVDGESDSDKPSASTTESKPTETVTAEVEKLEIEEDNSDIPFLHTTEELIAYLKKKAFESDPDSTSVVIGMVGYPNVGKSSTINCIYGKKKTSVSATPGKTKHFQTLIIDDELTLCDCPGLVMPSFGFSSSEMVLNCILPVDRMRDFFSPVHLLCSRVPRTYFEAMYSVLLPKPAEHEDPNRPPTAHELLTTVAFMKGFMSSSGIPDCSRAARLILKDVVSGKLRWIAAPPGIPQEEFDKYSFDSLPEKKQATRTESLLLEQLEKRNLLVGHESSGKRVDKFFFKQDEGTVHVQNRSRLPTVDEKGRIRLKKGKKEKLRRVYRHMDA